MTAGMEIKIGSCDPEHVAFRGGFIQKLEFDTIYLCAKFDDSSFSRSRYIIGGLKI